MIDIAEVQLVRKVVLAVAMLVGVLMFAFTNSALARRQQRLTK